MVQNCSTDDYQNDDCKNVIRHFVIDDWQCQEELERDEHNEHVGHVLQLWDDLHQFDDDFGHAPHC